MADSHFPNSLKPILPYLQRAIDFENKAPLVAFYCRTYAVQLGIELIKQPNIPDREQATNYVIDVMNKLERDKQVLHPNAEEGRATVELFALKIFKKADDQDRAGQHTEVVAKMFHASYFLMEVIKQFGELSEDILEKQKYAKWKAAEIKRALRTGSMVQPGPYQQQQQQQQQKESLITTSSNNQRTRATTDLCSQPLSSLLSTNTKDKDSQYELLKSSFEAYSKQQTAPPPPPPPPSSSLLLLPTITTTTTTEGAAAASSDDTGAQPDFNTYFSSNYTANDTRLGYENKTCYYNTDANEDDFERRLKRFQMENEEEEEEESETMGNKNNDTFLSNSNSVVHTNVNTIMGGNGATSPLIGNSSSSSSSHLTDRVTPSFQSYFQLDHPSVAAETTNASIKPTAATTTSSSGINTRSTGNIKSTSSLMSAAGGNTDRLTSVPSSSSPVVPSSTTTTTTTASSSFSNSETSKTNYYSSSERAAAAAAQMTPQQIIPQPVQPIHVPFANSANTVVLEAKEPSIDDKMKAQKYCKFAMSALQFDDVVTARKYIREAMELLGSD
jgi:vacuolar protein sorting-associated protein VTA1